MRDRNSKGTPNHCCVFTGAKQRKTKSNKQKVLHKLDQSCLMPSTAQRPKNDAGELGWRCSTSSTMVLSPSTPATCQNHRQQTELEKKRRKKPAATTFHPVVLPQDHTRLEQPAPGGCDSWVTGLLQVQTQLVPVNTTVSPPSPLPSPSRTVFR